jgi:HEPN domain-containing protein
MQGHKISRLLVIISFEMQFECQVTTLPALKKSKVSSRFKDIHPNDYLAKEELRIANQVVKLLFRAALSQSIDRFV